MKTIESERVILGNYQEVMERIAAAARRGGRLPGDVRLVVVTKGHPVQVAAAAVAAGARRLGENYPEEGIGKQRALAELAHAAGWPGEAGRIEWHMIGHIQSRKAELVARNYDYVHSLDSLKLARRLDRFAGEAGHRLPALLECNVSGEASKYGLPAAQMEDWPALFPQVGEILSLPNLEVHGLMTMAPFFPYPEQARPYFTRLAQLRDRLAARFPKTDWRELSMGMSADYEVAVQEGATLVRVGTAIFGPRTVA